jgi:hypothetical protein
LDLSGLVDVIEAELLEVLYGFGLMEVEAELYKLNVYGEVIQVSRWRMTFIDG